MARGKAIPGLEDAIIKTVENGDGLIAEDIHKICEESLGIEVLLTTVNSALSRLLKEGIVKKKSPAGRVVPFMYSINQKEKK